MSLIQHSFFPRRFFNMDTWMPSMMAGQDLTSPFGGTMMPFSPLSTLDLFDPFDELDRMMSRNLRWLNEPALMAPSLPNVPQKFRITLDCAGYNPNSISTDIKDNVLTVSGREEERLESGDFSVKEFKKTYNLPQNAETDKMISFMTGNGQFVCEVPLRETEQYRESELFPQIVDEGGQKAVKMQFTIPEGISPENLSVNIKDRNLVLQAEQKQEQPDRVSRFHYYKKTTLPENTDFANLRCTYDDKTHKIQVSAPLALNWPSGQRQINIERQKAIGQGQQGQQGQQQQMKQPIQQGQQQQQQQMAR